MKHECDKDVHDVAILRSAKAQVFYDERSNGWWMELGFGSCAIEYCPFCGEKLRHPDEPAGGFFTVSHGLMIPLYEEDPK